MGSEGDILPDHVGIPFVQDPLNPAYYVLQIHYDNPTLTQNVLDNSGLQLFYTDKLREFDASILAFGEMYKMTHVIPPGQKAFPTLSRCAVECTQRV